MDGKIQVAPVRFFKEMRNVFKTNGLQVQVVPASIFE